MYPDSMPAGTNPPPAPEHLSSAAFAKLGLPFSEMVRLGDTLYLSGQMGTLPGTLTLAPGGIRAEAEQALRNIESALAAQGCTLDQVVKCTVMLADMGDWFFLPPYPARSAFGANGLALGGRLEIEAIASATRPTTT